MIMKQDNTFDLQANRCPVVMCYIRQAIQSAIGGSFKGIVIIKTIEPSVKRDLNHYITTATSGIKIISQIVTPLTKSVIDVWIDNDGAIEDDFLNINEQHHFQLEFS
jgi:TusA-related sulfurtransferase